MSLRSPPPGNFRGLVSRTIYRFDRFIARGGEGSVFTLQTQTAISGNRFEPMPNCIAKVYGSEVPKTKVRKLAKMIEIATPEIRSVAAWPIDLLATPKKKVVGFVMPHVQDGLALHLLLTPKTRLQEMPRLSYGSLVGLAENLARAVASLHASGIVIGDINGQNFLVLKNGTVKAIDCDSMQIGTNRDWVAGVGVEDYVAPELQGHSLQGVVRTADHDNFALAVLIFELLMMGRHPFAGHADVTLGEAIRKRAHLFTSTRQANSLFGYLGRPQSDFLSRELVGLFSHAFSSDSTGIMHCGVARPTAKAWVEALSRYRGNLKMCSANANHRFPPSASSCTWCALEKIGRPPMFAKAAPPQRRSPVPLALIKKPKRSTVTATVGTVIWRLAALLIRGVLRVLLFPIDQSWRLVLRLLRRISDLLRAMVEAFLDLIFRALQSAWRMVRIGITIVVNIALIVTGLCGAVFLVSHLSQIH